MRLSCLPALALSTAVLLPTGGHAATLIADTVIDYFNSGANAAFPAPQVYGGIFPGGPFPVEVPLSYATDGDIQTFVSLPTDSFLVLGFSGGFVFDGPGNDLFVAEVGDARELADVFVSEDFGMTFTFLGQADGNTVTEFDLGAIGFTGMVNAVKIVGLDNFGGSPGFDLAYVEGLAGSVSLIPVPPALPLLGAALVGLGLIGRRRRHRV